MKIFKNFPSVSKLVAAGILERKEANLAYKINRAGMNVPQMIETVEAAGLASVTRFMDDWIRSLRTYPTRRHAFKELLNQMADGMSGVEYLGKHKNGYQMDYLNTGDSYCDTLIFHEHHDGTVRIGCWDDAARQLAGGHSSNCY